MFNIYYPQDVKVDRNTQFEDPDVYFRSYVIYMVADAKKEDRCRGIVFVNKTINNILTN